MIKFFELKRKLFFPQIVGPMKAMKDVPYLYDLLLHERGVSRQRFASAVAALRAAGMTETARGIDADWIVLDKVYEHDIVLCAQFMLDNGISPI